MESDISKFNDEVANSGVIFLDELRAILPPSMRESLTLETRAKSYFLFALLSNDEPVQRLRADLLNQYHSRLSTQTPLEQALALINQLETGTCDSRAEFKFRLPQFVGEYPVHSSKINRCINQFNQLVEAYHLNALQGFVSETLNNRYQAILHCLRNHHMGCNLSILWQLLGAMTAWSTLAVDELLTAYPNLLSLNEDSTPAPVKLVRYETDLVTAIEKTAKKNTFFNKPLFSPTLNYPINKAGRISPHICISIHHFGFKPAGHTDALSRKVPAFLSWSLWQSYIKRELSHLIDKPLNEVFFDWLQTVLQHLGVEFVNLNGQDYECRLSPALNHKTILSAINKEVVSSILLEHSQQSNIRLEKKELAIISRYLIKFLPKFQYNLAQALGIGADAGGAVRQSNAGSMDAFRINDPKFAAHFEHLSVHRQGPAQAHMNAQDGVKNELRALVTNFDYATKLQPFQYPEILYNALVDNLVACLFPHPYYLENKSYSKYRKHYVVRPQDDKTTQIEFFYIPDAQGTFFKVRDKFKQTPLFRRAGSSDIDEFPRDTNSAESLQSSSAANPLWPMQLQYAQCGTVGVRGNLVYDPEKADRFMPNPFFGQVIRETKIMITPLIGVVPKNYNTPLKAKRDLCASYVVNRAHSALLYTNCPVFKDYYYALASRFLPTRISTPPSLPAGFSREIRDKWQTLHRLLQDEARSFKASHHAFFSLFKELIHSLYPIAKNDSDLLNYFIGLTTSPNVFQPHCRATCERLIRELTTLKPMSSPLMVRYETILNYLIELTDYFYPIPCDNTAQAIATLARLHTNQLLTLPEMIDYFRKLTQANSQANISPLVSPGMLSNLLTYNGPSPQVYKDYIKHHHDKSFYSSFRGFDGEQMTVPTSREAALDKLVKSVAALLSLIYRNKTVFSLVTQPLSSAYIAGSESYWSAENYKLFYTILMGTTGFLYGAGLGISQVLFSLPLTIYNGFFAPSIEKKIPNHALAISSAPSNEPGLRVIAMMAVRDRLLSLIATMQEPQPSKTQLIDLLLNQAEALNPTLFKGQIADRQHYQTILDNAFPLEPKQWKQLFQPVLDTEHTPLQAIIQHHSMQINDGLIHALYDCLTTPGFCQSSKIVLEKIIKKHKLNDLQKTALTAFGKYYSNHPERLKNDTELYSFDGAAIQKLKNKEASLCYIQLWIYNALDSEWGFDAVFTYYLDEYNVYLNPATIAGITSELPNSIKRILYDLLSNPGQENRLMKNYNLPSRQKNFLEQCIQSFQLIGSKVEKQRILSSLIMLETEDCFFSTKTREQTKLTQFIQREWRHEFLSFNNATLIIVEIKSQVDKNLHDEIDELLRLYHRAVGGLQPDKSFDKFYALAIQLQDQHHVGCPLDEWVNVTMNTFCNRLLDKIHWDSQERLNPLNGSKAAQQWLKQLMNYPEDIRSLFTQQVEQADSLDKAAWRCQYILQVLENWHPNHSVIKNTGMQKLFRMICQNPNTMTNTGKQKAKEVAIEALCQNSITMQHALKRTQEKISKADCARSIRNKMRLNF